jgi:hypothetical protein
MIVVLANWDEFRKHIQVLALPLIEEEGRRRPTLVAMPVYAGRKLPAKMDAGALDSCDTTSSPPRVDHGFTPREGFPCH